MSVWRATTGSTTAPTRSAQALPADHLEPNIYVAARRVRIGTDLFVRFTDERPQLGFPHDQVRDAPLPREGEPPTLARADAHGASNLGCRRVAFLLLGHEVERAPETGGIAGREQMLGGGRARPARAAHLLGY